MQHNDAPLAATVAERLLAVPGVVCPACHSSLAAQLPDVIRCTGCGRLYPIRDGLPVLIPAEARLAETR